MSSTLSTIEVEAPAAPAQTRTQQPGVQPAETAAVPNPSTFKPGWPVAAWVVCCAVFAVAFVAYILFPAIATLVGAGGP